MAACALCGDFESEHTPQIINPARPCRVRVCIIPPTKVLPEGRYELCDCVGFESADEQGHLAHD